MGNAISACFKKYAVFSGRAPRSEYWYFILLGWIYVLVERIFLANSNSIGLALFLLLGYYAVFIIPTIAVGVRRMHDIGKSGWFILIPIYSLILCATPSSDDNQYGLKTS